MKKINLRRKKNAANAIKGIITAGQGVSLSEDNLKEARTILQKALVSLNQVNTGGKVVNIALMATCTFLVLKIAGVNDG